jgi:hypothetical protein
MSVEAWELHTSRSSSEGDSPTHEQHWMIKGTDSDLVAKGVLAAASHWLYDGLVRKSWRVEPAGYLLWRGFVMYGRFPRPQQLGESRISFDMGGGNIHVNHTLQTVAKYAPQGETPIDSKGLIGVTKDRVDGVDIPSREFHWSETHILPANLLTDTVYPLVLYKVKGSVNVAAWRAYAAGEVLCANVTGGTRDNDTCELTFSFAASPNLVNLKVGDIQGIAKQGWDYLWVRWEDDVDDTAKALVKKPRTVYVDRPIERTEFALLGIG